MYWETKCTFTDSYIVYSSPPYQLSKQSRYSIMYYLYTLVIAILFIRSPSPRRSRSPRKGSRYCVYWYMSCLFFHFVLQGIISEVIVSQTLPLTQEDQIKEIPHTSTKVTQYYEHLMIAHWVHSSDLRGQGHPEGHHHPGIPGHTDDTIHQDKG